MSTTDDLSTRLLEAIDRRERVAHLTDFDHENRMCQAHREIVEMYLDCRANYQLESDKRANFVGTEYQWDELEETIGVAGARHQLALRVVGALASAYGIQEEAAHGHR